MYLREISPGTCFVTQPSLNLINYLVRVLLRRAVLGKTYHARLRRVPVASPVHVDVRGPVGQPPQGVAESGDGLSRLSAAQFDVEVF